VRCGQPLCSGVQRYQVQDALIQFYRAFNARDLNGLAANWEGDAPSMDNPIGGIRRRWPAIREGYSKLFNGTARVQVAFQDFASQGVHVWHLFVGCENGVCKTPMASLDLPIRTTRWFIKTNGVWRQLHHHGSMEEPALLADFKSASEVRGLPSAGDRPGRRAVGGRFYQSAARCARRHEARPGQDPRLLRANRASCRPARSGAR